METEQTQSGTFYTKDAALAVAQAESYMTANPPLTVAASVSERNPSRNPSRNAMLDDLANLIDICARYAICTGMDEHFVSDLKHLRTVALNNKEDAK